MVWFSSKTIFLSRELIFTLNHPLVSESEFLRVLPKLRTVIFIVFDYLEPESYPFEKTVGYQLDDEPNYD